MNYNKKGLFKLGTFCLLFAGLLISCRCGSSGENVKQSKKPRQTREQQIENQRAFLAKERESIENYIADRDIAFERTGTGLYYAIIQDSATGATAESGDEVAFTYSIQLLNGSELYSDKENGVRYLLIDKQDAEIGVHEALKKLGLGDEGLFILPSHLAFGIAGDQQKVPPVTALLYKIKLIELNKQNNNDD